MKLSLHFDEKEFTKQAELPADVRYNLTCICKNYLEPLRLQFGPIIINSGWRTPEENSKCGGAKHSYHLSGRAVDIRCKNMDDAIRKAAFLLTREEEFIINTNLIAELIVSYKSWSKYPYWLHLAVRKSCTDKKHLVTFSNYG